jgi:hypothetical protein
LLDAYERMRWGIIKRNICICFALRKSERVDRVKLGNVRPGSLGAQVNDLRRIAVLGSTGRRQGVFLGRVTELRGSVDD